MKRIFTVSLVSLTAIFLTSCQSNELIKSSPAAGLNGGFETVEEGYPVNWAFFPNPESSPSLQVVSDSEHVREGQRALKIVIGKPDRIPGFRSRRIPVQSGRKYTLAMSVRTEGCKLKVNRVVLDASRTKNLRSDTIVDARDSLPEWKRYEETLAVSEDEAYVFLIFLIDGSGTLWCDDISIEEIT
jgi:hypothetical protein